MDHEVVVTLLDEEKMTEAERKEFSDILGKMKIAEQEELEAEQELEEFLCSEIEIFDRESIRTKEALIESVATTRKLYQEEATSDKRKHNDSFYSVLDGLLAEFSRRISVRILPEPLNDWWSYSYEITSYGVKLMLNYYGWSHTRGGDFDCSRAESITVFEVAVRMLTVSEYAAMNRVAAVTVRQWIRRAKIRCAMKYGREWLIPELAEVPTGKSYTPCRYYWKATLTDLPEKMAYLHQFKNVYIEKSEVSKDTFILSFNEYIPNIYSVWDDPDYNEETAMKALREVPGAQVSETGQLIISGKARAELELYLIGNPVVHQHSGLYDLPTERIAEYGTDYCGLLLSVEFNG